MAGLLLAVAAGLAAFAWSSGGAALAWAGLEQGAGMLVGVVPLLLAAFLVAGLIQVLVTRDMVSRWMGGAAGWKGIALACVAGALTPGGPYIYFPIGAALLRAGASLGVLVTFVSAKTLWSATRLPLEIALLGPRLTFVRFVTTLAVPPLLGAVAQICFGRYEERIRQAAPP